MTRFQACFSTFNTYTSWRRKGVGGQAGWQDWVACSSCAPSWLRAPQRCQTRRPRGLAHVLSPPSPHTRKSCPCLRRKTRHRTESPRSPSAGDGVVVAGNMCGHRACSASLSTSGGVQASLAKHPRPHACIAFTVLSRPAPIPLAPPSPPSCSCLRGDGRERGIHTGAGRAAVLLDHHCSGEARGWAGGAPVSARIHTLTRRATASGHILLHILICHPDVARREAPGQHSQQRRPRLRGRPRHACRAF